MKKFVFLSVVVILLFTGCKAKDSKNSDNPVMNVEYKVDQHGNQIKVEDGECQYFYQVEEGKKGRIAVDVQTDAGSLDLEIYGNEEKNSEDKAYSGKKLGNAQFTVNLSGEGEYRVLVKCHSFTGKYNINFIQE